MTTSFRLLTGALAILAVAGCDTGGIGPEAGIAASPVVEAEPVMEAPVAAPEPTSRGARARADVLTAGDIDDTLNLGDVPSMLAKARDLGVARTDATRPVLAQVVGQDGRPAPGIYLTLRRPGARDPFYEGYSGVDGMVTVFPSVHGAGRLAEVEMRLFPDGQGEGSRHTLRTGGQRSRVTVAGGSGWVPDFLDLVFVIDTTGSMGDEIAWLQKDLGAILTRVSRRTGGIDLRLGLVAYRDEGDAYVTRNFGFTRSERQMARWLRGLDAQGGGDYPEAADRALAAAASLPWRRGKGERIVFHIADAPPHSAGERRYLAAVEALARRNVQIFSLGASGVADEAELLMRQAAVISGGRYLFLTDDSGVGFAHAEPRVRCYRVTALTGLVARVLASELSGRRIEATKGEIVREVGRYDRGRCLS